jgi:hypothetical protein
VTQDPAGIIDEGDQLGLLAGRAGHAGVEKGVLCLALVIVLIDNCRIVVLFV